jgi:hypothetical protein
MPFPYQSMQAGYESHGAKADQLAVSVSDGSIAEVEYRLVADDQTVWPSAEARHLATAAIQRGYILPETMQHPAVQFECLDIAFLIMAWGLAPTGAACRIARDDADTRPDRPATV